MNILIDHKADEEGNAYDYSILGLSRPVIMSLFAAIAKEKHLLEIRMEAVRDLESPREQDKEKLITSLSVEHYNLSQIHSAMLIQNPDFIAPKES